MTTYHSQGFDTRIERNEAIKASLLLRRKRMAKRNPKAQAKRSARLARQALRRKLQP